MWRVLPVPMALAGLLHLAIVWPRADANPGQVADPVTGSALQVRTIEEAPPKAVAAPVPPAVTAAPPTARRVARTRLAPAREAAAPSPAEEPTAPTPASTEVNTDLVVTVAAAAPSTGEVKVPVYRTVLPPATTLRYDLRKGLITGSGEISWKPAGDRYEARLEGSVAGVPVITEVSTGLLDANGIAPVRYTDKRSRRATMAANFQREKGKITYSGPQVEFPLLPGSQDRLSWMLQIAGVLNAQPQLASPGERIVFFVSGAHGDAEVWTFRYVGTDSVRTDAGAVRAVKFTREPRKPYDRLVEVWLAPDRKHLPIRARFTAEAGESAFELLLRDMRAP